MGDTALVYRQKLLSALSESKRHLGRVDIALQIIPPFPRRKCRSALSRYPQLAGKNRRFEGGHLVRVTGDQERDIP
jgi:hypothetical protein